MAAKKKDEAPAPSMVKAVASNAAFAMQVTGQLLAQMDEAGTPEEFAIMQARTVDGLRDLAHEIDKFGAVRTELERWAEAARQRAKWLTDRAKAIETMIEQADELILGKMKVEPTMPLAGEVYRVKAVNNSGVAKMTIALARQDGSNPVKDKVYLTNVIDDEFAFIANLPSEFLVTKSYTCLDNKAIRAALEDGQDLKWATLERGQSLAVKEQL